MRLGNVIEKKLLPLAFPTEFRERPCVVMVEFSDAFGSAASWYSSYTEYIAAINTKLSQTYDNSKDSQA